VTLIFTVIYYFMLAQSNFQTSFSRGGVAYWVVNLTRYQWMIVSCEFEPHQKLPLCFLEQETFPSLLRTGWFQKRI